MGGIVWIVLVSHDPLTADKLSARFKDAADLCVGLGKRGRVASRLDGIRLVERRIAVREMVIVSLQQCVQSLISWCNVVSFSVSLWMGSGATP